ncbi:1,4-alpha-glucan branching protein GlgB [Aurantimonas endophytica]|uniref:1,4-alpha-glucan branching enzyme GlgB n=1 Tax=Aurantimonas endophytica TaxID=1522175 RepID=A0A7W6MPV4_9HYPH|nr:1,4-alpha-glucan branching protein GlgB [Aurantimonas endophytica]MBB4003289.1 1,4-alpha-glucan branching enzyme [Aurantimonas endophytica]MCO6404150.1 1,4-alpha-glucan branching protein GlgB [Aurantimonas endophytica]
MTMTNLRAGAGAAPIDHRMIPEAAAAIANGQHGDPFAVLGPHAVDGGVIVRVFRPGADSATVIEPSGSTVAELESTEQDGLFSGFLPGRAGGQPYRLRYTHGADSWEEEDTYRFGTLLGEQDVYFLAEGNHYRLYERLGAHPTTMDGVAGTAFAVWAPNARRVSVVGNFNSWDGRRHAMRQRHETGMWELFVPGIGRGEVYKYELIGRDGNVLPLKADPVGFRQEMAPSTASIVDGLVQHEWQDAEFRSHPTDWQDREKPISIYEVHLGSWMRGDGNAFLDYDDLARELVPYVRDMGFTHVELLPVSEHPFYGSWGYQPIGLFAPTARHGTPEGFARLVDAFHQAGIGVLLDWVPGHFPTDVHGLGLFDGTPLYEHPDPKRGFHKDWNTLIYDYGRREVENFLVANGLYWLDQFHIDGLRVDAVASMLYLDYSREHGEWEPNIYGGRENLEAMAFLKDTNERVGEYYPKATTHAEESTAFPDVSRPTSAGGLGFHFKWNMGWMHDTLHYMQEDPINRRYHHHHMTFGMVYAYSENFVLPLSHDEVVYGKGSLLGKMPGDQWQKFANLRAYFGFMWNHPGKKLIFMGGEFGQVGEWNHDHSLDWHLLDQPEHKGVQRLVRDLNTMYREIPALHELDCDPAGFEWVDTANVEQSVIAFLRKDKQGRNVLIVSNFTPVPRHDYAIGVPQGGRWIERLNTDAEIYGGSNVGNLGGKEASEHSVHGRPFSISLTLPPLATIVLVQED